MVEDARQREVQQRPQLREVVLQRRARQDEPVARVVVLGQRLRKLALRVLHTMALI